MSFWTKSDNTQTELTDKQEMIEFPPLPDNTTVRAMLTDFEWKEFEGSQPFISFKATILAPAEYKSRVLFLKLAVLDIDDAGNFTRKRDRGLEQLSVMLRGAGYSSLPEDIQENDEHFFAIESKMYTLMLGYWNMPAPEGSAPGTKNSEGNWLKGISLAEMDGVSKQYAQREANVAAGNRRQSPQQNGVATRKPAQQRQAAAQSFDQSDEDIPF